MVLIGLSGHSPTHLRLMFLQALCCYIKTRILELLIRNGHPVFAHSHQFRQNGDTHPVLLNFVDFPKALSGFSEGSMMNQKPVQQTILNPE